MIHENFYTKHSVFTAPDVHMHTSLSNTLYERERERERERRRRQNLQSLTVLCKIPNFLPVLSRCCSLRAYHSRCIIGIHDELESVKLILIKSGFVSVLERE